MDWQRHDNNIYEKMTDWFDVVGKVFQDYAVQSVASCGLERLCG
jgi:hypothetical protein